MYPRILGIYSRNTDKGHGEASAKRKQQTHWFVRRLSDDEFEVRPLNPNHVPSGVKILLGKGEFVTGYTPEPQYYERNTLPALKSLSKKIELGEQFFKKGLLSKAEQEFLKATMIDEENAKANLGLGSVYAEQGEFRKIKKVLARLLNNDEVFQEEQRRQFNTFGIGLRKQKMYEEAIAYYSKALEYDDKDENLYFNLARAHFDKGDEISCLQNLEAALKLRPDFEEARKFMAYAEKH